MAIAFDAKTGSEYNAGTSGSFSHTCTGSNRGLLAFTYGDHSTATVSYGGVSMTRVGSINQGNSEYVACWKLENPASGSNTFSYSDSGGGFRWTLVSYTGVDQTNMVDTSTGVARSTDPASYSISTATSNCWAVAGLVCAPLFNSWTAGTQRNGTATNQTTVADSNGTFSSSYTFTVDFASAGQSACFVVALKEPAISSGPSSRKTLLGVGK